ncbi:MAG: replication initiation protein [Bernardetiaceae bacterium]|nr:replication initiation protein [Bernardetiaceae bacterium]
MKETDNTITIRQDNALTTAKYEMTALEKNILYLVMSQIKKEDPVGTLYRIPAKELMRATGEEIRYNDLQKATEKLITRLIRTTMPNGDFLQVSFVASAQYLKGKGMIEIELSQKIRPLYMEVKEKFTTFQLYTALTLNSKYAKRIYEMLSMYKHMNNKSFQVSVDELKERLGLIDPATGKDIYPKWTHFENKVLAPAEREINEKADLRFSYQTSKEGRKVAQIVFTVYYQAPREEETWTEQQAQVFERLVVEFGLRKDQAKAVLLQYSLPEINKKLYEIKLRKLNKELKSPGAYTAKIFGV